LAGSEGVHWEGFRGVAVIFQETIYGFIFQGLILLQPLFWMWLHNSQIWFRERAAAELFTIGSVAAFFFAWSLGVSMGYYTTFLILQYIVFTVLAVYLFNTRRSFKHAISLGFLVVFLNSFYWEAPLHLAELLGSGPHIGMLVQVWRLAPLPFLLKNYSFDKYAKPTLAVGLFVSTVIMYLRIYLHIKYWWIYPLNRLICLLLLVKVVTEAKLNETE